MQTVVWEKSKKSIAWLGKRYMGAWSKEWCRGYFSCYRDSVMLHAARTTVCISAWLRFTSLGHLLRFPNWGLQISFCFLEKHNWARAGMRWCQFCMSRVVLYGAASCPSKYLEAKSSKISLCIPPYAHSPCPVPPAAVRGKGEGWNLMSQRGDRPQGLAASLQQQGGNVPGWAKWHQSCSCCNRPHFSDTPLQGGLHLPRC